MKNGKKNGSHTNSNREHILKDKEEFVALFGNLCKAPEAWTKKDEKVLRRILKELSKQ